MANEFIIRKGYKSLANSEVTGSLKVDGLVEGTSLKLSNGFTISEQSGGSAALNNWVKVDDTGFYTTTNINMDLDDTTSIFRVRGIGNATLFKVDTSQGSGKAFFYKDVRLSHEQNAGSRLELYNNRQDAGNVEIYRIAAYNSAEVAGIHFYRGSGGNSGYTKIFAKRNNASSLEEVAQFGTNDSKLSTFAGNINLTGGGTIEAPSVSGAEKLTLKAAGGLDFIIDSNGNGADDQYFKVMKHTNTEIFSVKETGVATISNRLVVNDNTSQPLSSIFEGTLVVQGGTNEDPIIAVTDVNTANAAAGLFHQSSTSPGFPALVVNAASNGSEQPLISARTNVSNTTGTGGTEVFKVDGDGDAVFTGTITGAADFKATGSNLKLHAGGNHILSLDLNGKIYPSNDAAKDLGFSTSAYRFRNGYFSGNVYAGNFHGDGSNITGVTAEWDGSHTGNASITGNLTIGGNSILGNSQDDDTVIHGSLYGTLNNSGTGLSTLAGFIAEQGAENGTKNFILPGAVENTFAGATERFTVTATKNGTAFSLSSNCFRSTNSMQSIGVATSDTIVITVSGRNFNHSSGAGIAFSSRAWRAKSIEIETSTDGTTYTSRGDVSDYAKSAYFVTFSTGGTATTHVRYILTDFATTSTRISHIFSNNYLGGDAYFVDKWYEDTKYNVLNIDSNGAADNYYLRLREDGSERLTVYENNNNVYFNGYAGNIVFRPQVAGTGNFVVSGGNTEFDASGNASFAGDVTVAGTLTAQEFKSELISSSIIYESGSTKFGDTSGDNHDFTGSLNLDGDLTLAGTHKIIVGPNTSWSKSLIIGDNANNSTADAASIGITNGNLHLDAATGGSATYLNYYDGTAGVAFGNGAAGIVAWMGPDGDLWKGSSDNNGSKYWHSGNDGPTSGLAAQTAATATTATSASHAVNSDQINGFTLARIDNAEAFHTFTGINAASTQAKRYHIGRLYGCPAHWDGNWQNMDINVTAESYESGHLRYRLMGDYGGAGSQANMMDLYLKEASGPMVGRFRFVLGTPVDAGWDHSGQDTFYVDLYAEAAHYSQWEINIKTYGHGTQNTNPTSGGATTVFYDTPTVTNISTFDEGHATIKHLTNEIYHEGHVPTYAEIGQMNYTNLTGTVPTWNQDTTGLAATATSASHSEYADAAGTATSASHATTALGSGVSGTVGSATSASHSEYADDAGYAASAGSIALNNLTIDGKKLLDMPSNSTERGPWNPIVTAVRGSGRKIHDDEDFTTGTNGVQVYNNSGGTGVVITRETDSTTLGSSAPNSSGYVLKIVHNGNTTSPGHGGFISTISSQDNHTFVQIFQAKLQTGRSLVTAENAQGSNNTTYWLTNTAGTGKWEWYARVSHCGDSGTFSGGGHVYVSGGTSTFTWYLASCTVYNVTDSRLKAASVPYSGLTGTVPTWNQSTTGNAATATTASNAMLLDGIDSTGFVAVGGDTMTGTLTSTLNGTAITMDGGASAEGIRMTADATSTYPVFLRSIAASNGETSPWIYKENNTAWGIWHNNPINSFDFTRSTNNLGIENNVGGQTNSVMIRLNNTDGSGIFKGNVTAATFVGALTGNAATATTASNAMLLDGIDSTGFVAVGGDTMTGDLVLTSAGTGNNATLQIDNPSTSTFIHSIEALGANLTANQNNIIIVGKTGNTKNSGYIGYKWKANASNTNILTFGHWGSDNLMNLTADGKLGIGVENPSQALEVTGGIYATSFVQGGTAVIKDTSGITVFGSNSSTRSIRVGRDGTANDIFITGSNGNVGIGTNTPSAKLDVYASGSTVFEVNGSQGQLFSITDSLSGSLFSVSDISGTPLLEVESDSTVTLGDYNTNTLVVTGSLVGIGTATPSAKLHIVGDVKATNFIDADNSSYSLTPSSGTSGYWTINTPNGYIQIGAMNTSHGHIYTDRPSFYFNKSILVNGNAVLTTANGVMTTGNQTIAGNKTFTGGVAIKEESPTLGFADTTSGADDFFIHVNSNNFYVLADRDDSGNNEGLTGWDGAHPLQLEADTNISYTFGNRIMTANLTSSMAVGSAGSATTASHALTALYSGLEGTVPTWNQNTTGTAAKIKAGGTGPSTENLNTIADSVSVGQLEYRAFNSSTSNGPSVSDNANGVISVGQHSSNYSAQLAFSSNGNMYWRDNPNGVHGSWRKMWDSGNDGATSGLAAQTAATATSASHSEYADDAGYAASAGNAATATTASNAMLLDGIDSTAFLRSNTADTATGEITFNGHINLNNTNVKNVNTLNFNDPGPNEGITWSGGNWKIYESPNDLTTNSAGNLQFVSGSTRVVTFGKTGETALEVYGSGSTVFDVQGSQGQLFSITDDLTGDLLNVSDISGIPILTVNASGTSSFDGVVDISEGLNVGEILNVGDGSADTTIEVKKADNNVADHIKFFNGTTRVGEIGASDNDWLRINQETAKNIYTPRYFRADGGLFVDDTNHGINSSGVLTNASLQGTYTNTLTFSTVTIVTPVVGSSNKIKFANNDYIRYDDSNGVGRFHFDADGGTNNASVQAATFVGALSGNATTVTNGVYTTGNQTIGGVKTFSENISHTGLTMTDGLDIDQIKSYTKSLSLTTNWIDTGVNGSELATGTYIIQVTVDNHDANGQQYDEMYSGTMSWYGSNTNSTNHDEIVLHAAGHARNDNSIFLRVLRTVSSDANDLKLQIKNNRNATQTASNYIFKFRRMI